MAKACATLSNSERPWFFGAGGSLCFLALLPAILVLGLLIPLSLCLLVPLSCHGEEEDGMPTFRRLLLPPERLPEELKRVQDGVLVRLPAPEFDALVERAAQAVKRKFPPRLLEARYHAMLQEESLIGEGQWKLIYTGPGPGLLNLQPFNLALRQARFENGDARIAAFDGKTPALLVETPGERMVSLDWSARAESGPEGLQFHLEVPSCPVVLLELDVPAGRAVAVLNDSALLSGPHEAEAANLRRWKIVCGGRQRTERQRIDIRIYPANRPDASGDSPPAPFIHQKITQKLRPEGLDATFELTLDSSPQGIRELICECDAQLRLRDVIGPGVDRYAFQAGDENKPARLTVRLREPVHAGTWQILCLAPLSHSPWPSGSRPIAWRSPGLRLVNAVPRGETLTLWLHPDLRVESWDPGSFRLSSLDLDRATGGQVLTLLGGGSIEPTRRPTARLQAYGVEFATHQLTWWRCDASGMALTVQIGWEVSQGQLFQLPVLLPAGWNVEKVEMAPAALLRDWYVRKAGGNATLFVNLANPIEPSLRRLPALTVHLRPANPGPFTEKRLPFPDAVPLGARFREGALALDCDEQLFHLQVHTRAERTEPENEGPWGQRLPEYYYRYRGQNVTGEIRVQARPPRLRAQCHSEVFITRGEAIIETQLLLEAESGSPNTIELSLSAGNGVGWPWHTETLPRSDESAGNRVRRVERVYRTETSHILHLLAASHPLQAAAIEAARPTDERWRLTLARPLRLREPLRLQARRRLQAHDNRWDVPLPVVLGAEHMEGEVVLHLTGAGPVRVHSIGLHEAAFPTEGDAAPWRTFRYGQEEVHLILAGEVRAFGRSGETGISPVRGTIERAYLITYAGVNGTLRHHFLFQIANWGERRLPLRLPPGSRPLAVQMDGRWLPQLLPSSLMKPGNDEEAIELALPVPVRADAPSGDNMHRFEIVYTRIVPSGVLWQSLDAPAPQLPIAPLAFCRLWRLPPQLTPLRPGRYQSLPGTDNVRELAALPHRPTELFRPPGWWAPLDLLREKPQASARAALKQISQELRDRHVDQKMSLRELVSELSSLIPMLRVETHRYSLVLDDLALREAGVRAETRLTIQRSSSIGEMPVPLATTGETPTSSITCTIIAVPGRSAILLTTNCGRGAVLREPFSEEVENALAEAAQYGQDISGRFRSALNWLHPESIATSVGAGPRPLDFDYKSREWSEWEPIAGVAEERMIVVHRGGVAALGWALGLLVPLLFWLLWRRIEHRLTLLLLALALFGLGVLWLPAALHDLAWWPLLTSGAVAGWSYLCTIVRQPMSPQSSSRQSRNATSSAAIIGILILGFLGWHGRAATPAPATVYLIPPSADAPDRQTVLVPADLLDRLQVLARPALLAPGGPQTVLLDASYEGQLVDEGKQAEFTATFSVHSLSDEPSTLTVPLDGVGLVGEVLLDGARVAPLAAPQAGYSLPIRGRGRHKIELRFRVPVVGTIEDRNVLFTAPPLLRSRLSWRVPDGAVEPQVLVKNGAQWITRDSSGQRLEADLGALPLPVHLHWYQPNRPTRASYQAAYLWDLGPEVNRLTTWLRYRVEQGAVQMLEVELPAELEVSSANAQRTLSLSRQPWRARFQLRDWHVTRVGNQRVLHLRLPYPISGDFQVILELLPRTPLTSPVALPLPSPRGIRPGGPHYLAYRTQPGLNAQRETSQNLTRISNKEFAPDWLGGPSLEAHFQGIAYRIPPDRLPQLILRLEHRPPVIQGEVDVTVRVGTQQAEIEAVADVTTPNKDRAALEWELPPHCVLAAAAGEEVRSWKQNGSRLLIWLNRTTAKTRIHLSGWLPLSLHDGRPHLELNGPRLLYADKQYTRLHLTTADDLILAAVRTRNLQPARSRRQPANVGRSTIFETFHSYYNLECQVQAAANAVAKVLTLAEAADRELCFTTTVDYTVTHGELRQVQLRLRNWEEEKVEIQAERVALWSEPRRSIGGRSWLLPLQAGVRGHYQVVLHGRMPLAKAAGGVPMPEVLVQGVERAEYFVAVAGGGLTGQAKGTFQTLKLPHQALQAIWPDAAQRLERNNGQAWRVGDAEWQVRLLPQLRVLQPTPARLYLLEQWAAAKDGRRWLHEARCWLHHEAHADLAIDFAAPVRVFAVAIDGVEGTPLQPSPTRLWLPLPSQAGVRCIHFRWLYDPPEPLDRPNLTPPQLVGAVKGPTVWTVTVPPGWQAVLTGAANWQGATREAALALWRADVQLHISQDLAKERRDNVASSALAAAQQRFTLYCRHAQQALDLGAGGAAGPQNHSLTDWLAELQANNRLLKPEIRNAKSELDKGGPDCSLRISDFEKSAGIPTSGQVLPGAEPPTFQLISRERQQIRQALAASGQWLGALAILWILSTWPFLSARLHLFWPEQIALLGAIGWHLAGPTVLVLGLLLIAACSRIFLGVRGLRTFLRKRRQQPSTMTAGNGVVE